MIRRGIVSDRVSQMRRSSIAELLVLMPALFLAAGSASADETVEANNKQQFEYALARGGAEFKIAASCVQANGFGVDCSTLSLTVYHKRQPLKKASVTCRTEPVKRSPPGGTESSTDWTEQRCSATVTVNVPQPDTYTAVVSNGGADDLSFNMEATHTDVSGVVTRVSDSSAAERAQRRRAEIMRKLGVTAPDGVALPGNSLEQLLLGRAKVTRRVGSDGAVSPPARTFPPGGSSSPSPSKPPTTAELITGAEADFRYGRYDKVIATCLGLLEKNPDHPQLNLLLGKSYYAAKDYERSITYLAKAVSLGERVSFPVAHHRRVFAGQSDNGPDNDLSAADLIILKDTIELRRTAETTRTGVRVSDESFVVPLGKIYELKYESDKDEKLRLAVGVPQAGGEANKEKRRTYNLYPAEARVEYDRSKLMTLSKTQIRCASCSATTRVIYGLLSSLRK